MLPPNLLSQEQIGKGGRRVTYLEEEGVVENDLRGCNAELQDSIIHSPGAF